MNYIKEINSFYDWIETNRLSKSAIALWHALMHINNKANWAETFEVAISTLEFKTGFKRAELCEARNILLQKGRIKWKTRGGNLSAIYKINPFCVHTTDTNTTTSAYTNPTQTQAQKQTTNKQEETKLNQTLKEKVNKKEKPMRFSPPSYAEIEEFFINEKNLNLDDAKYRAESFFNHDHSIDWKIGRNKMVNWKSAAAKSLMWDDKRVKTEFIRANQYSSNEIERLNSVEQKRQILEKAALAITGCVGEFTYSTNEDDLPF